MTREELTRSALIEVLREFDIFACDALCAYAHKFSVFDTGQGRFTSGETFLDAVTRIQAKLRIVEDRLKESL